MSQPITLIDCPPIPLEVLEYLRQLQREIAALTGVPKLVIGNPTTGERTATGIQTAGRKEHELA